MSNKKKSQDPNEVELLDVLNEVGGVMKIKYHTAVISLSKSDLQIMRENGIPTDISSCIAVGLGLSGMDNEKLKAFLAEANTYGAAPSVTFEVKEGEALNIKGRKENPMVDIFVRAVCDR